MPRLRLSVCLALALASPGLAAPIPIPVTGWVGDAHGKPLAGARVTLSLLPSAFERQKLAVAGQAPEPVQKAASDAAGSFTLAAPDAGMWTVRIEAAGAVPVEIELVPLVETQELPPFPTAIAADAGVEVRVVDGQGRPVPAVRVAAEGKASLESLDLWRPAVRRGETGPDGRLRLPRVRGERLKIRAMAPGYPVAEVESGEAQVLLRLSPTPSREVLVRGADGSPVAGALVTAGSGDPASALTDENGRATVFAAAGKKARPVAWTADGRRATARAPSDTSASDPAAPLAILLPRPPERMSGLVVDRLDRQPLAEALVWPRQDPAAWVRADDRGSYALPPAPAGKTWLAAAAAGHLPGDVVVPPAGRGERALRAPTFALEPAAAATGVVVDVADKPVAGALVSAAVPAALFDWTAPKARARSGSDGRFALRPLAAARPYEVTASLPGFAAAKLTLAELKPKAVRSGLRLVLRRGRTVRGRVVDDAGRPVAAAVVQLLAPAGADPVREGTGTLHQTTADTAGQFAVEGLLPGKIDLFVRAPGFPPASRRQVAVPAGAGSFDLGPIPLGRGVALAGIVVDGGNHPVAGAAVHIQAEEGPLGRWASRGEVEAANTGADGRFAVPGLARGPAVVTVEREGFAPRTLTGVKAPLPEPLRVVLSLASRLAGEVVDDAGVPVPGARLRARSDARLTLLLASPMPPPTPVAMSDDDGHFELRDAPTGKMSLYTSAPGFLPTIQPVELAAGQSRDDLRVVLHRGSAVVGRVLAPDGTPAADAEVSLAGPSATSARADGDGNYGLDAVPPGPRTFTAQLPGTAPTARDLTVRPGENRLDFQLGPGLEVAGRVVDPAGAPVGGARVALSAGDFQPHETASGDDGSFRFPGLRGGAYRLSARLAGFAEASQEVKLAEASLQGVELRLGSGGAVAGRILGLSPEQLARVRIGARKSDTEPSLRWIEADAQGEYRIPDLPPGDWTVMAQLGMPGRSATGRVQLPPGVPEVRLDLEFPGGLTLSGHLRRAGQPVPGAIVGVRGTDVESHGTGRSDTQGAFQIEGLKTGTYELVVSTLAAGQLHKETLEITADREVEVDLPTAEVRGKVVDADDGSPVAEAAVSLEPVSPGGSIRSGLPGRVLTGPDGAFVLEGGAEGDYRVVARKDLYAPAEAPVHLADGRGVDDVKLAMTAAKGLRFTVHDATGSSPATVSAALLDPAGQVLLIGEYPVSDGGRVRISEAPAGHWRLVVAAGNTATATAAVDVPGPRPAITLPDPTHLTVLVPELVGRPGGATLEITGADGLPYRSLRFGFLLQDLKFGEGRIELDDVPPGAWRLRVEVPGGKAREGTAVTAPGVPAEVVLRF
ncbi:MAG TPA: carboxypeptidase regulatory-like domain-containing protein [Thermoanaerobaculia bacterium]|nr:carboxypeptidase regulatory-like domain-containing protein [Thermoanaerobaculia bacterium]